MWNKIGISIEPPSAVTCGKLQHRLQKITEQIFLESLSRRITDKNIIGNIQHGSTISKLCLTNLTAL